MTNKGSSLISAAAIVLLAAASPALAQQVVRLPAADAPLRGAPQTVFSVGTAEGREWEVFGGVADVAFDAAENLYVLDRPNARVVVFDPTGRFIRTFGKRGGGPGEFALPQRMTITAAGEVAVSDVGHRAILVFGTDGRHRRNIPFAGASVLMGGTLAAHPRGGVVSRAIGNPSTQGNSAFGDEVILWYPDGGGAPTPILTLSSVAERRTSGSANRQPPVFSPVLRFAVLPSGDLAFVDSATYAVRIVSTAGRVQRVLRRPIAPRRVTAADREWARRRQAEQLSGGLALVGPRSGPVPPALRGNVAAGLRNERFADVMPVVKALKVDASGNLWIERSGPSPDRPGPIDIVTPAGRYLGTLTGIRMPAAISPGGRAAYVETDELGVERVVVARLPARLR